MALIFGGKMLTLAVFLFTLYPQVFVIAWLKELQDRGTASVEKQQAKN